MGSTMLRVIGAIMQADKLCNRDGRIAFPVFLKMLYQNRNQGKIFPYCPGEQCAEDKGA